MIEDANWTELIAIPIPKFIHYTLSFVFPLLKTSEDHTCHINAFMMKSTPLCFLHHATPGFQENI